jgi:hypothetical protein
MSVPGPRRWQRFRCQDGVPAPETPGDRRLEWRTASDVERSDVLRSIELVVGDREKVDHEVLDRDLDLAKCLRDIGMHDDSGVASGQSDFGDGHDGTGFVLRQHQ